jgi:Protein of unknown function (DUF3006)
MSPQHSFSVDRLHDEDAVLVDDQGHALTVSRDQLPNGIEERIVIHVEVDSAGTPNWSTAKIDADEAKRHKRDSDELSRKLRESDQYGFLHPKE